MEYIDELVKSKLIKAVYNSLIYIMNESGDVVPVVPLFELSLKLHDPMINFVPSIDLTDEDNFVEDMTALIEDIFKMGEVMKRIDPEREGPDYFKDVKSDPTLAKITEEILSRVMLMREDAYEYIKEFDEYVHFWTDDRQEYLRQFLMFGGLLSQEELKRIAELKETPPTVPQFKEQIDQYDDRIKK